MTCSVFQPLYAIHPQKLPYQLSCTQPKMSLRQYVYRYVQVDVQSAAIYPVYPDAGQSLYVGQSGAFTATAIDKPVFLPMQPGRYFGIWFYPGAGARLLPQLKAAFGVAGTNSVNIELVLLEAKHLFAFAKRADELLDTTQKSNSEVQRFDALLTQHALHNSVAAFAKKIGISERHANRLSQQYFAVSLKKLLSLRQLQHLAKQALANGASTNEALANGFFDQAHMINKFRRYYHCTPNQFATQLMSEIYN